MNYKILFLGLSLFLYGAALAIPCLLFNVVPLDSAGVVPSDPSDVYAMKGIELTFFGIIGLLFLQVPAIGWLANPIYWLCCILFMLQRYRLSAIAGIRATKNCKTAALGQPRWCGTPLCGFRSNDRGRRYFLRLYDSHPFAGWVVFWH